MSRVYSQLYASSALQSCNGYANAINSNVQVKNLLLTNFSNNVLLMLITDTILACLFNLIIILLHNPISHLNLLLSKNKSLAKTYLCHNYITDILVYKQVIKTYNQNYSTQALAVTFQETFE